MANEGRSILAQMTLDEKIGQMLWSSCPTFEAAETASMYGLGGYVLFGNNFEGQTKDSFSAEISRIQNLQKIPMAFAVDEEGGTVTRISGKTAFSDHEFESPRTLYKWGKLPYIQSDADEKANLSAVVTKDGTRLSCELLIAATGFAGCREDVCGAFGVDLDRTVKTEAGGFQTSVPHVFAAGDMRRGQSLVVHAIAEGRACAAEVDRYLMGYTNLI